MPYQEDRKVGVSVREVGVFVMVVLHRGQRPTSATLDLNSIADMAIR
jgi:hypothetical protein